MRQQKATVANRETKVCTVPAFLEVHSRALTNDPGVIFSAAIVYEPFAWRAKIVVDAGSSLKEVVIAASSIHFIARVVSMIYFLSCYGWRSPGPYEHTPTLAEKKRGRTTPMASQQKINRSRIFALQAPSERGGARARHRLRQQSLESESSQRRPPVPCGNSSFVSKR